MIFRRYCPLNGLGMRWTGLCFHFDYHQATACGVDGPQLTFLAGNTQRHQKKQGLPTDLAKGKRNNSSNITEHLASTGTQKPVPKFQLL